MCHHLAPPVSTTCQQRALAVAACHHLSPPLEAGYHKRNRVQLTQLLGISASSWHQHQLLASAPALGISATLGISASSWHRLETRKSMWPLIRPLPSPVTYLLAILWNVWHVVTGVFCSRFSLSTGLNFSFRTMLSTSSSTSGEFLKTDTSQPKKMFFDAARRQLEHLNKQLFLEITHSK